MLFLQKTTFPPSQHCKSAIGFFFLTSATLQRHRGEFTHILTRHVQSIPILIEGFLFNPIKCPISLERRKQHSSVLFCVLNNSSSI